MKLISHRYGVRSYLRDYILTVSSGTRMILEQAKST